MNHPDPCPKTALCLICLFVIIGLVSCTDEEPVFEPVSFDFNQDLIDTAVVLPDINLQVSPPRPWLPLDTADLDLFRRMIAGTELCRELYPVYPLAVFSDSLTGCMMYVASIEEAEMPYLKIADQYEDFLRDRREGADLTVAYLSMNDMNICQYVLRSPQIVNYKLLGETRPGTRFLIEYVVRGDLYTDILPAVQSSIASLSKTGGP